MSNPFGDLEFLVQASNFGGGENAPHSPAARKAVEAVAERIQLAAEFELRVAKIMASNADPEDRARQLRGEG